MRAPTLPENLRHVIGSAPFAAAVTSASFLAVFGSHLIRSLLGWPGLFAVVIGLVVCAGLSFWFRRSHVDWHGLLPISLIVFVGWAVISVFWAESTGISLARIGYLLAVGFLGCYVALLRDTIQVVRSLGDALRILLGASLVIELLSGVLIDTPIRFLGIQGNIANLGPIQGLFGSRNMLGFVALIGLITFSVELATRSIPKQLGRFSIVLAALLLLFSRSPVVVGVLAAVAIATLALFGIRRIPAASRRAWQAGLLLLLILVAAVAWFTRTRVIDLLNAGSEFETRLILWREMLRYMATNPLQGWGWVGSWPSSPPFLWINLGTHHANATGLNAFVDVYFQLGLVGLVAFIALIGFALVRSWLLASDKRSIVFVWPALVLVALATLSFAESTVLFESGWLLLVICSIKASRNMSWRDALRRHEPSPLPSR